MKKKNKSKNYKKNTNNFMQIQIVIYNKTTHKIVKKRQILQYFQRVKQTLNLSHFDNFHFTFTFLNENEIQKINRKFRQKDKATNILTFPYDNYNAEFFICPSIIATEAAEQSKSVKNHYIHMIIHGFLHAFGYDHVEENQASEMESLEVKILQQLNIKNPYE